MKESLRDYFGESPKERWRMGMVTALGAMLITTAINQFVELGGEYCTSAAWPVILGMIFVFFARAPNQDEGRN